MYLCVCAMRLYLVPLKPQGSHGDFDIFHAKIGHSQLPQDLIDCRGVSFFCVQWQVYHFSPIGEFNLFFRAPIYQSNIIFICRKFHWNSSKNKGDMNCYLSKICNFHPNLEKCHFWAILGNYWQFSDMGKKFLKMDYTKFLVFNFMSLLSKPLKK